MTQQSREGAATMAIDPKKMEAGLVNFLQQASHDERLGERLALAQTTVHIHLSDDAGLTLLLDRTPVEIVPGIVGTTEVEMWGSADLFADLIAQKKQMAMSITSGEMTYKGPVRKFLRIVPILRSFDFARFGEGGAPKATESAAAPAEPAE